MKSLQSKITIERSNHNCHIVRSDQVEDDQDLLDLSVTQVDQEGFLALINAVIVDGDGARDASDASKEEDTRRFHSRRSRVEISQTTVTIENIQQICS